MRLGTKSLWWRVATNTLSVKLAVELLQCNFFFISSLSAKCITESERIRRKYDATVLRLYFGKSRNSSGTFCLFNGVVQLDQCFIQYFIWQIFSEFTILIMFQAAVLDVKKKKWKPSERHGLTTSDWWMVRQFQLWFKDSWILWSPSGEWSDCLEILLKVTNFVINTSYNTTSDMN